MHKNNFQIHIFLIYVLIHFMIGSFTTSVFAKQDYWPTNGWRTSTPEAQGMDSQKLINMMETLHDRKNNPQYGPLDHTPEQRSFENDIVINSITIVRNGYIVFDAYFEPFEKNTKKMIYSCAKSITSILVGIALDKGYIKNIQQHAIDFFPERKFTNMDDQKKAITVEHLLTMSSGLLTKDDGADNNEGLRKLFKSPDWVQYVLDLPMDNAPGTVYNYSNCVTFLLSAIVSKSAHMSSVSFAEQHLFSPLGITDFLWAANPTGKEALGAYGLSLNPHAMAKIGLLYLNNGHWENKQIVSEAWVKASTSEQIQKRKMDFYPGYGYQWHIGFEQQYVAAAGNQGQIIFLVPEKDLVVVFTGNIKKPINLFFPAMLLEDHIIPAAISETPLNEDPKKIDKLNSLVTNLTYVPSEGYTWTSKEEGSAKDGKFIRTASPAFRYTYPKTSSKITTKHGMFMETLGGNVFGARIFELPEGSKSHTIGPDVHADFLKGATDVKFIYNKQIKLKDGTLAYMAHVNYTAPLPLDCPLKSLILSIIKEGKIVTIAYNFVPFDDEYNEIMIEEGMSILNSVVFN